MKSAFLATKSVSHFSAIMAAKPSFASANTQPSEAARSLRFAATACPFLRIISIALSKSFSASIKAFLQSIIPAPVMVRNFEISAIVTAIISLFISLMYN